MRTRAIQPGDLILANKQGRLFHARVQGLGATGGFAVAPIERNVSYRQVSAREVVDHWRHAGRDKGDAPRDGQTALDFD